MGLFNTIQGSREFLRIVEIEYIRYFLQPQSLLSCTLFSYMTWIWPNDTAFRFWNVSEFIEARTKYGELAKSNGDLICPRISADVKLLDERQLLTFSVDYVSGGGHHWAQHFNLNYYRKDREGRYECSFMTVSPTREGLELGKRRLEDALRTVVTMVPVF